MGDRRPAFSFRFWSSGSGASSRRTPATTTSTTTAPAAEAVSRQLTTGNKNPTSMTPAPPTAATQTPASQSPASITDSNPTTSAPTKESRMQTAALDPKSPSKGKVKSSNQPAVTTSTSPTDEPKTLVPSNAATRSPSSPLSASPSFKTTQSRSPPQSPSPSRASPKARTTPPPSPSRVSSKTMKSPSTTQTASQRRSPSRPSPKQTPSTSSPKVTQPTFPSKESKQTTQEIHEKDPKLATSQQEPQPNAKAITAPVGPEAHTPIEKVSPSTINDGHEPLVESNAEQEETKDVKEVVQATKIKTHEMKKDVDDSLPPKSGSESQIIEKAEIPNKVEQMQNEKQEAVDTKETFPASLPSEKPANAKTCQLKKRSTIVTPFHNGIMDNISTFVNKTTPGDPKNAAVHDRPVSVITLAGENRGASMQMGSDSSKREGSVHIHRSYKINPDEATTDGEGNSQEKAAKATEDQPKEAYVNNNAQGINNSIVLSSSVTERNPGVHMIVSHVPKEPIQSTDDKSGLETRKVEFNTTCAEKLTYEPMVRRRCLRGLFLETSDSDPDNPEKPRRHGCRVGCQQRDKENDIDVL